MIYNIFFILLLLVAILCATKIAITDFRRRIIPDAYLFPLLLIGLVITTWFTWPISPKMSAFGGITGYLLATCLGCIFEHTKKHRTDTMPPIGMGDTKLIGTGGIWLGPTGLSIALIIACVFGIIWGRARGQKYIPFAPFFITAGFLSFIIIRFLI